MWGKACMLSMYIYAQYIHMNMYSIYNTYMSLTYYTCIHTQKQGYVFLRAHQKHIPSFTSLPISTLKERTPLLCTVTFTPPILHSDIILHLLAPRLPLSPPSTETPNSSLYFTIQASPFWQDVSSSSFLCCDTRSSLSTHCYPILFFPW